ncbi:MULTISPECIES: SGNH/GDSL hydrolase family protein [Acidiphilium]|uniref:SGNH/GDSL hydrolase family protein n=1 Tax=Acidiphilium iwatense TaxID=768198 RepID=A0ABS9DTM6_9PROT|nr:MULTISPECIES: SGNH/GDSL hydrolase family protein [Acidiphilium]MCF3946088.1 SGNH/GDSL hydrolase family protein [Acidiphilium iwatense]
MLPFLLLPAAVWAAPPACPPAPVQQLALPHLKAALMAGEPVVIAALGSSSTWGAMAHDIADSYPAELQDDLATALPGAEISVINRGISGEDARREDARMARDVLALRPTVVIWQVGANAAARREPVGQFSLLVRRGLRRLRHARADIVLMDNQRSHHLLASPENARINAALARLARRHHASLFSRDALMRAWQASGARLDDFLASDGLHMNDRGYACTAAALARSITDAVR